MYTTLVLSRAEMWVTLNSMRHRYTILLSHVYDDDDMMIYSILAATSITYLNL